MSVCDSDRVAESCVFFFFFFVLNGLSKYIGVFLFVFFVISKPNLA